MLRSIRNRLCSQINHGARISANLAVNLCTGISRRQYTCNQASSKRFRPPFGLCWRRVSCPKSPWQRDRSSRSRKRLLNSSILVNTYNVTVEDDWVGLRRYTLYDSYIRYRWRKRNLGILQPTFVRRSDRKLPSIPTCERTPAWSASSTHPPSTYS